MKASMRAPIAPVGWSIALHAVLAGLLFVGLTLPKRESEPLVLPIDAVIVDSVVLEAAGRRQRDDDRRETLRREQERQQQEEEAARRAEEEERIAAEQKAQADAELKLKAEADAKRKAEREAEAKAAAEKKRVAEEQRDRDQREADLRAQLADEETRTSAGFQSLKAKYVRAIQAHVEQRWFEPPGVSQGLSCTIHVRQIPGGEVVGTRFGSCNGGAAVRQSIENAVRNASPLPAPPEPALFEREVELVFTPKESRR